MEIRRLKETEYAEALALSEYAFQFKIKEEELEEKKEALKHVEVLGEFNHDTLLAKVQIIPLEVFISGKSVAMGGISSVATWPEHRRNRSVARLLKASLESMKDKGQLVSLLAPFNVSFYRKFGWELTTTLKKCVIETKDLRFIGESTGSIERIAKKNGYGTIKELYKEFAKTYHGMLNRSDQWWDNSSFHKDYQAAIYFDEKGQPTGYMFYTVKNQEMDIKEFVYLNHNARVNLWNFICQHDSMVEKVKLELPENDPLPMLLPNPKVITQELVPYFMARIVDLKAFLVHYEHADVTLAEQVAIKVSDDTAEWNNGVILIGNEETSFYTEEEWTRMEGTSKYELLETDIQTLSAMFFGAVRPKMFSASNRLCGPKQSVDILESWLPDATSTFYDFF